MLRLWWCSTSVETGQPLTSCESFRHRMKRLYGMTATSTGGDWFLSNDNNVSYLSLPSTRSISLVRIEPRWQLSYQLATPSTFWWSEVLSPLFVFIKMLLRSTTGPSIRPFLPSDTFEAYIKIENPGSKSTSMGFWRFGLQNFQKSIHIDPELKKIDYFKWQNGDTRMVNLHVLLKSYRSSPSISPDSLRLFLWKTVPAQSTLDV